jgi:type I restriction enzyme R subunit
VKKQQKSIYDIKPQTRAGGRRRATPRQFTVRPIFQRACPITCSGSCRKPRRHFTGTPIFQENSSYKRIEGDVQTLKTTGDLFQKELHQYTITHAIEDRNVLRFHADYFKPKTEDIKPDKSVSKQAVINAILDKHDAATGERRFNALLATASINDAIDYYNLFESLQMGRRMSNPNFKPLKIAAVFSPPADVSPDVRQLQEGLPQE